MAPGVLQDRSTTLHLSPTNNFSRNFRTNTFIHRYNKQVHNIVNTMTSIHIKEELAQSNSEMIDTFDHLNLPFVLTLPWKSTLRMERNTNRPCKPAKLFTKSTCFDIFRKEGNLRIYIVSFHFCFSPGLSGIPLQMPREQQLQRESDMMDNSVNITFVAMELETIGGYIYSPGKHCFFIYLRFI